MSGPPASRGFLRLTQMAPVYSHLSLGKQTAQGVRLILAHDEMSEKDGLPGKRQENLPIIAPNGGKARHAYAHIHEATDRVDFCWGENSPGD